MYFENILLKVRSDEKPDAKATSVTDICVVFSISHARVVLLSFMYWLKEVLSLFWKIWAACERLICR